MPKNTTAATSNFDFNYAEDTNIHLNIETEESLMGLTDESNSNRSTSTDSRSVPISRSTMIFAMCAALNSCNLGYDIGVNTSAGKLLQESLDLTNSQLEIFMGSLNMFAAIGAIGASTISDRFGRRGGFIVAAVGFIVGMASMSMANSYTSLMIGRAFVGLGVGFGLAIDPIYIAEISPAAHRGRLVTWSEIAINVGILFGFSTGLVFHNLEADAAWRIMFGLGAFLPLCLIILVLTIMPESPRWLVSKGREAEAQSVLNKVYPPGYNVSAIVQDIKDSLEREKEAEQAVGWDVIFFPSPAFKRMLIVGLGTAIAQQIVGIEAIQYYMLFIIEEAGVEGRIEQSLVLIFLGVLKMAVIIVAGKLFDTTGRRPLFFASLGGMIVALIILAFSFLNEDGGSATVGVIGLASYLCFFSLGMGPGAWLIPAEVFSTTIRTKAMSMAAFLNRIVATIMTMSFLTVADVIGWSGFFFVLALICALVMLFLYWYLPETKGLSLEDMSSYFAKITWDRSILEAEERLHGQKAQSCSGTTEVPVNFAAVA